MTSLVESTSLCHLLPNPAPRHRSLSLLWVGAHSSSSTEPHSPPRRLLLLPLCFFPLRELKGERVETICLISLLVPGSSGLWETLEEEICLWFLLFSVFSASSVHLHPHAAHMSEPVSATRKMAWPKQQHLYQIISPILHRGWLETACHLCPNLTSELFYIQLLKHVQFTKKKKTRHNTLTSILT